MFQVEKRDGTIAEFQMKKITDAIGKAFGAKDMQFSDDMLQMLALRVTADFQSKIKDGKISVEAIQDSVENVLIQCGYAEVAKAYILYRKQREKIRNMKSTIVDYKEIVDSYVKVEDWRVKENSTVTYSVGGLILSNSGAITANYWLSEIYDDEIAEAHRNADIHIHDLSMLRLLCRMVVKTAYQRRTWRHQRKDYFFSGKTSFGSVQPDGQLPWHYAERVGRCAGIFFV